MTLTRKAWQLIANAKIEQAIQEGQFNALPGFGKPLNLDPANNAGDCWLKRKAQQEKALAGFSEKIEKQQRLGHLIQDHWSHVEGLLEQTKEAVERDGWSKVRKALKGIPWIVSAAPAERTFTVVLPDEDGEAKGPQVVLELDAKRKP